MYFPDFEVALLFSQFLATVSTIPTSPSTLGILPSKTSRSLLGIVARKTFQAWLSKTACSFNVLVIGSLLTVSYGTGSIHRTLADLFPEASKAHNMRAMQRLHPLDGVFVSHSL